MTSTTPASRRPRRPVLVIGAGSVAGVAVIRALAGRRPVVAADRDPDAVGLHLAREAGVLPGGDEPDFAAHVAKLAARTGATALICTVPEDVPVLHEGRELLAEAGLRTWLPSPDAVTTCLDGWRFAMACAAAGVPAPATGLATGAAVPGPWIVRPRFGGGSRDVLAVDDADDLPWALRRVPDPIVQTRLVGEEFTVDALVDRGGRLAGAVPRWRLDIRAGITTRGRTFASAELVAGVAHLLDTIGLTGPATVQGFVDGTGRFAFTEVKPRMSSGLSLSLTAGADFVGEYLRGIDGRTPRPERLVGRAGVAVVRHLVEVYPA